MLKVLACTFVAVAALSAAPLLAQELEGTGTEGWYVIVGSHKIRSTGSGPAIIASQRRAERDAQRDVNALRAKCDFHAKVATIMFSPHFPQDLVIVYRGAYRTRAQAEAMLPGVKPCKPDAYVKFGSFTIVH